MDFIERWFGVFPDGGNGSLEVLCLLTAIAALFAVRMFVARGIVCPVGQAEVRPEVRDEDEEKEDSVEI